MVMVLKKLLVELFEEGILWMVNFFYFEFDVFEFEMVFCCFCNCFLFIEFVKKENGYFYVGYDFNWKFDLGIDVDVCLLGNIVIVKVCLWWYFFWLLCNFKKLVVVLMGVDIDFCNLKFVI